MKKNILIDSMHGLGDNIYQRPFVKNLVEQGNNVYIRTVLPGIYNDIKGLRFIKPGATYRTQEKSLLKESQTIKWCSLPESYEVINPLYDGANLKETSIIQSMKIKFSKYGNMDDLVWDLPYFGWKNNIDNKGKPIAIIRPGTVRNEWRVTTRNADPKYINYSAAVLKEYGYYVISIADVDDINEFLVGQPPAADLVLHKGELGIYSTLDLMSISDVVVGGSGFILPATVSMANPHLFVIFGGRMMYDSPYKVFHPSMNMKKISWATPTNPCYCTLSKHDCNKNILDFDSQFMKFIKELQK